jgi:hypothetical protein
MSRERFWPTPAQALLLGFCLQRDAAAATRCWGEWKAMVPLDDLDYASFPLMCMAWLRVAELGIADPDLGRIKGLYRYQWAQSQVTFRGKRALIDALEAGGLPVMLLRGAALACTVYPEATARGWQDTGVLVPMPEAARAVAALAGRGWMARDFDAARPSPHGCGLLHPEHGEAWLSWRPMRAEHPAAAGEGWWQAARPLQYETLRALAPCAADHLIHICEMGMDATYPTGLLWLADCVQLIRNSRPALDWDRVVAQSRRFQVSLYLRAALGWVREHLEEESIPAEVLTALERVPVPLGGRIEYYLSSRPDDRRGGVRFKAAAAVSRYLGMRAGDRLGQLRRDLPHWLRVLLRPMAR